MTSWPYVAGFFDGEGSITRNGRGYRITIPQTNLRVLSEIRRFSRIGYIAAVTKRHSHWRDAWIFYIAKQSDVQLFLRRVGPYLIIKRAQAKNILQKLDYIVSSQKHRRQIARMRKVKAKMLHQRGLSYRAIGRALGIDWGYARRIILGRRH